MSNLTKKLNKKLNKAEVALSIGEFRQQKLKVASKTDVKMCDITVFRKGEKTVLEVLPHEQFGFIYKVHSNFGFAVFQSRDEVLEYFKYKKSKKNKKNKNK